MQLEGKVDGLCRQVQDALKSYNEATEDRRIESMRSRDQCNAQDQDTQTKKLQKMQVSA